jgi:hypothetical protein
MDDEARRRLAYEAQRRKQRGESERAISRALAIHRNTVSPFQSARDASREHGESALKREVS